jgi:mannose-6-phosphate isomerase-like protein (cupin superfamily)|tara:strand:- start:4 stop:396 length:393 start_codon:yes stop_codon:yes gene_type:complete
MDLLKRVNDKKKQVIFVEPGKGESFTLKGIQIDQLLPREACEQFSAYLVNMKPFQIKKPSYHKNGEELYYVISGFGTAILDENNYDLKEGCFFRVPPGTVHQFSTDEQSLCLLNLHSPPVFSDKDTYFVK